LEGLGGGGETVQVQVDVGAVAGCISQYVEVESGMKAVLTPPC
jgi:hypothetical protein